MVLFIVINANLFLSSFTGLLLAVSVMAGTTAYFFIMPRKEWPNFHLTLIEGLIGKLTSLKSIFIELLQIALLALINPKLQFSSISSLASLLSSCSEVFFLLEHRLKGKQSKRPSMSRIHLFAIAFDAFLEQNLHLLYLRASFVLANAIKCTMLVSKGLDII